LSVVSTVLLFISFYPRCHAHKSCTYVAEFQ